MGNALTENFSKITQRIINLMKQNQKQTCENFADLNSDMDDIRKHLLDIEAKLNLILSGSEE